MCILTTRHAKLSVKLNPSANSETAVQGVDPRTSHKGPGARIPTKKGISVLLSEQSTPWYPTIYNNMVLYCKYTTSFVLKVSSFRTESKKKLISNAYMPYT